MGVEEDGCNTVLVLGLGFDMKPNDQRQKPGFNLDRLFSPSTSVGEPSLTLGFGDETYKEKTKMDVVNKEGRQSSPQHSIVSSFSNVSVKREKDLQSDGIELERVSSRISDEDEEGSARKKLRLTKEQSALLEDSFKEHSTLTPKQKQALAKQLNLRPRQVEVWFQNRRARTKLKQTEVDCEFLKRCCETLTDENRRLHKELQELKALKYASPALYMQLPAATLAMCPSCERIGGVSSDNTSKNSFTAMAPKSSFCNPFTHSSAAC